MAFIQVTESWPQEFAQGVGFQTGKKTFVVRSDTPIEDLQEVATASHGGNTIPIENDSWSGSNTSLKATQIKPVYNVEKSDKKNFFVNVDYATPPGGDNQADPDPTARDWEIAYTTVLTTQVGEFTLTDVSGYSPNFPIGAGQTDALEVDEPIDNTAKDLFNPPPEKPVVLIRIKMSKNYANLSGGRSVANLTNIAGSMNNSDITLIAGSPVDKWQGFMEEINHNDFYENGIRYYKVDYSLLIDFETHVAFIRNAGFNQLGDDDKKHPITIDGEKPTNPQPLDLAGQFVTADNFTTAFYIAAGMIRETDWTGLGLPTAYGS